MMTGGKKLVVATQWAGACTKSDSRGAYHSVLKAASLMTDGLGLRSFTPEQTAEQYLGV